MTASHRFYSILTNFICPAAVFLFDKSQRKTAAGRAGGGVAPATPFGVRSAENGKQNLQTFRIVKPNAVIRKGCEATEESIDLQVTNLSNVKKARTNAVIRKGR